MCVYLCEAKFMKTDLRFMNVKNSLTAQSLAIKRTEPLDSSGPLQSHILAISLKYGSKYSLF